MKKDTAWREFEKEVGKLYVDIGATGVTTDTSIDGNQIDVYADVPCADGTFTRTIISCKYYKKRVGVGDVREWNEFYRALINKVDVATIITTVGFTKDAQALARSLGIKLMLFDNLKWANVDLRPYLKAKIEQFQKESAFAKKCYIPMRIRYDGTTEKLPLTDAISSFLGLDDSAQLFLLLGDFGSGKTTSCKYIFQHYAQDFLDDKKSSFLPIFISLKEYPFHLNLESLVTHVLLNEYRSKCPGFASVRQLLAQGKIFIMLDAFDEMASKSDYRVTLQNFQHIRRLMKGKAKVIVTCRTHYFKDKEEFEKVVRGTELYEISKKNNFVITHLDGFNANEIKKYVRAVCGSNFKQDYAYIENTYNLLAIAERPILLEMITTVLPNLIKEHLEITSTTLYEKYTKLWLDRDDWRTSLNTKERERFTIAFAEKMYHSNKDSFSWREVEDSIRGTWSNVTRKDLDNFESDIRTCSFIKRSPDTDKYSFVHESFLEFFVSSFLYEAVLEQNDSPFIGNRYSQEILGFLYQRPATSQIINTVRNWLELANDPDFVATCFLLTAHWQKAIEDMDFTGIQFKDFECSSISLSNLEFDHTNFSKIILKECSGQRIIFKNCAFDDCDLNQLSFNDVVFAECRIRRSRINLTKTTEVCFNDSLLDDVVLDGGGFAGVYFKSCRMTSCTFTKSALRGVVLEKIQFVSCDDNFVELLKNKGKWNSPPHMREIIGLSQKVAKQLYDIGAMTDM